jgi:hypothetical protein
MSDELYKIIIESNQINVLMSNSKPPFGIVINEPYKKVHRGDGISDVIVYSLSIVSQISIGVFVSWLWDRIKDKNINSIVINKKIVKTITKNEIKCTLEEVINLKIDQKNKI